MTKCDPRFSRDAGLEVFTGNELLVKGALETTGGVHLLTGYPGSPIAGFFDALGSIGPLLNEKGIVAKIANNEALSVAMVNGAQMAHCRAITAFKSVGLHVASDALALGVLAGTRGDSGGLIVCGDDTWSESTQVPSDSRFLAEHVRMPMIEPSNAQELKDWVDLGFKLGQAGRIYIGYLVTVALADGGGTVECRPNHYPVFNEHQRRTLQYDKDIEPLLEQTVLLPPRTGMREMGIEARFAAVKAAARQLGINRILHRPQKDEIVDLGFIASGMGYAFLTHALREMGLSGRLPILKLGMSYPVDEQIVREFARHCRQIVVIEERRNFVERQVLNALYPLIQSGELPVKVYGKTFPGNLPGIPSTRGLNPSLLIERLIPLVRQYASLPVELTNGRLTSELELIEETSRFEVNLPARTPTFCPGCPHRDSSSVLLELRQDLLNPEYMLRVHKRKPVDLVCHGDTGCYTMLMFAPNKPLMHNYSGMGLGGGTGTGVDPFIDNKQLVFMGDGTFFHSGMAAISQSIYNGQDITYIILDNKTTAMTGHQCNPGDEVDLRGNPAFAQDIERTVIGMVPRDLAADVRVVRINPADRKRYRRLLEETLLADGVKVVIADKECGITFHRRARSAERKIAKEHGFLPRKTHMSVASEVCEFCLECTTKTGCPGLTIEDTDYGPKIQTDDSWCVNDGACERVGACPSFEEVTVVRKAPPREPHEAIDLSNLPEAPKPIHADQDVWRCYLAGVGGMGIGMSTAILVTAGHFMGYHVQFLDKKGLAIRNGGVFSQLVYTRGTSAGALRDSANKNCDGAGQGLTAYIPYGKADLLLGVDLLEALRAIDPSQPHRVASPQRTAVVVNTLKTPTILTLMGENDFDIAQLEETLRRYTRRDQYVSFNVGTLCEHLLGSKQYANIMMLGIAYQRGYLPVRLDALENAIRTVVRSETDRNLRAFHIGRKLAVEPEAVLDATSGVETARRAYRRKVAAIHQRWPGRRGRRIARRFRALMKELFSATRQLHNNDALMRDIIIRTFDCLLWGGLDYAREYCQHVISVFEKDDASRDYALTRAAVWNLARVMLIKDEIYVSQLLTSPEKYERDRRRFNIDPSRGDRIIYKHHNRPEFVILGQRIRFEWKSRDWQLRLMARARWLRKLMPGWHRREREFRDWYLALVRQLDWASAPPHLASRNYERWLAILRSVETVTGFREVREPRMEAARRLAERYLATDPELFEPPGDKSARRETATVVPLPVLATARR